MFPVCLPQRGAVRFVTGRRAIFLPIIRNNVYSFLAHFDYPDPTMPTGHRSETVVAPQALLLMNNELVLNAADTWANRLLTEFDSDEERISRCYRAAFCREPTPAELHRATVFVGSGNSDSDLQINWALFCQSLMAGNEFIYLR